MNISRELVDFEVIKPQEVKGSVGSARISINNSSDPQTNQSITFSNLDDKRVVDLSHKIAQHLIFLGFFLFLVCLAVLIFRKVIFPSKDGRPGFGYPLSSKKTSSKGVKRSKDWLKSSSPVEPMISVIRTTTSTSSSSSSLVYYYSEPRRILWESCYGPLLILDHCPPNTQLTHEGIKQNVTYDCDPYNAEQVGKRSSFMGESDWIMEAGEVPCFLGSPPEYDDIFSNNNHHPVLQGLPSYSEVLQVDMSAT